MLLLLGGCADYAPDVTGEQFDKTALFVYGLGQSPRDKTIPFRAITENAKVRCVYVSFDSDVAAAIGENKPYLIVAYSAGGQSAINGIYANPYLHINRLILLDPVPSDGDGFFISNNVGRSDCYLRRAVIPPYSKPIIAGANYQNHFVNWDHADFPAFSETIIKDALQ
jgi:hypothetical protein